MTNSDEPTQQPAAPPQALPIAPSMGDTTRYDSEDDDQSLTTLDDDEDVCAWLEEDHHHSSSNDSSNDSSSRHPCWLTETSWRTVLTNPPEADTSSHIASALHAAGVTTMMDPNWNDSTVVATTSVSTTLYLPQLPMDTLHRLSTFLTCEELCALRSTTKKMEERCKEVWRRVRMHAGRCLGEVMLAWAAGEHADARELASLYLQSGVPIYPAPHDHVLSTIAWRMGLEIKKNDDDTTNNQTTTHDPFYTFRYPNNDNPFPLPLTLPSSTYCEEKADFWKTKKGIPSQDPSNRGTPSFGRRRSTVSTPPSSLIRQNPTFSNEQEGITRPLRRSSFSASSPTGYTTTATTTTARPTSSCDYPHSIGERNGPKLTLRIHRHLVDQHYLFHLPSLRRGEEGRRRRRKMGERRMETPPVNMNADFFHPPIEITTATRKQSLLSCHPSFHGRDDDNDEKVLEEPFDTYFRWRYHYHEENNRMDGAVRDGSTSTRMGYDPKDNDTTSYHSTMSDVNLQIYSMSSPNPRLEDEYQDRVTTRSRVRFAAYQRKLESCFTSTRDYNNALLDWWDELLPLSAGIHFHNGQSPIPRMTHLQSFLTTPCPKALGVVQCEIERVKLSSKKKLFPTYEYRLFIRDVKNDHHFEHESELSHRKDSVLLVAKNKLCSNRVKKNAASNTTTSTTNDAKRGVTNYYMCLPQKRDVLSHYKSVNKSHPLPLRDVPLVDVASSTNPILGRVQSNFIGTEFQIFSPVVDGREGIKTENASSSSPEDEEGSNHPSSLRRRRRASADTPNTQGKNGLVRLARRASLTMTRRASINGFRRQSMDSTTSNNEQMSNINRRLSFTKSNRTKRSAVANSKLDLCHRTFSNCEEEEIGAITYTANLLGNRPRIMDVCVPKLDEDGTPAFVWMKPSSDEEGAGCHGRMLNQFKAIQQTRDVREQAEADGNVGQDWTNADTGVTDDNGLLVLQNRPPWWNTEIGAFVLNFGGRVNVASVKNFQLCERTNQDHIMLQFGRISGRHSFTMDFQHPLTPIQAFAIAISSLQSKISFG